MTPYQQQAAAERSGGADAVLEKAKSKRRHWAQENTLGMARRFSMAVAFLREAGRLPMITSCMAPRDASRRLYRGVENRRKPSGVSRLHHVLLTPRSLLAANSCYLKYLLQQIQLGAHLCLCRRR